MAIEGYVDYQRREFCKDVKCSVQMDLDCHKPGDDVYEQIRRVCRDGCKYTAHQFHQWLINKGYLVVRPE